jgi:hypothetical protein
LQAFASFKERQRLTGRIQAILSDGSPSGTFEQTDFAAFQAAVPAGLGCKLKARVEFQELVAKYPRWCYDILADQKDISVEDHELYDWQKALQEDLSASAKIPLALQLEHYFKHSTNNGIQYQTASIQATTANKSNFSEKKLLGKLDHFSLWRSICNYLARFNCQVH